MLNINYRKNIINYLNKKFKNYKGLQDFCNSLNNNLNDIIQMISKVIKYAFANPGCFYTDISLSGILDNLKNVEEKYQNIPRKKISKGQPKTVSIPYPLDSDIDLQDLIGLNLPSVDLLTQICHENMEVNELNELKTQVRNARLQEKMVFSEVGFTYETEDLIFLDNDFTYFAHGLTGEVTKDFRTLYSDERYQESSPLNNSYEQNIMHILSSSDIRLIKTGEVYNIVNGRHRILYLLEHGTPIYIRAMVTKRIENKRINELLLSIQSKFDVEIYKDNPYKKESNILIIYQEKLYLITNAEDLERFDESPSDYPSLMPFRKVSYNVERANELIYKIMALCILKGIDILDISFIEIVLLLNEEPNTLLYEAYLAVGFIKNRERINNVVNNLDKEVPNR